MSTIKGKKQIKYDKPRLKKTKLLISLKNFEAEIDELSSLLAAGKPEIDGY